MTVMRAQKAPIGIQRRMLELGVIRFGEVVASRDASKKAHPRALDKFRLTSASKALLVAAGELYGTVKPVREWKDAPNPGMWEVYLDTAELPVILPPVFSAEDGSATYPYSQAWELWAGATCERRCDGEVAVIPKGAGLTEVACLCDPDNRTCDIVTRISVMLPDLPGIGLWRLNTGGKYAAAELPGTLQLLSLAAAQRTYLRCTLRLEARSKKTRAEDGKVETHRFVVPVLDPGITPGELLGVTSPQTYNVPRLGNGAKPELPAAPERPTTPLQKPEAVLAPPPPLPASGGLEAPPEDDVDAEAALPREGDPWLRAIHAIGREAGLDHDAIKQQAAAFFGWGSPDERSLTDLNPLERGKFRQHLEQIPPEPSDAGSGPPGPAPTVTDAVAEPEEARATDTPPESAEREPAAETQGSGTPPAASEQPAVSSDLPVPTGDAGAPGAAPGPDVAAATPLPVSVPTGIETFQVYAAAALGMDAADKWALSDLTVADLDQVMASLGLDGGDYEAWWNRLSRPLRMVLIQRKQSPSQRADRAIAAEAKERIEVAIGIAAPTSTRPHKRRPAK